MVAHHHRERARPVAPAPIHKIGKLERLVRQLADDPASLRDALVSLAERGEVELGEAHALLSEEMGAEYADLVLHQVLEPVSDVLGDIIASATFGSRATPTEAAGPTHQSEQYDPHGRQRTYESEDLPGVGLNGEGRCVRGHFDPQVTAFMHSVYDAQVGGSHGIWRDLASSFLDRVEGQRIHPDVAPDLRRLLADARAEIARPRGNKDHREAPRPRAIGLVSGYRSMSMDLDAWVSTFCANMNRTRAERAGLTGGPYSQRAVALMLGRMQSGKTIPGRGNHSLGRAVDFSTDGLGANWDKIPEWKTTWFYAWLHEHAAEYNFHPYSREPWHWEHRPPGYQPPARTDGEAPAHGRAASSKQTTSGAPANNGWRGADATNRTVTWVDANGASSTSESAGAVERVPIDGIHSAHQTQVGRARTGRALVLVPPAVRTLPANSTVDVLVHMHGNGKHYENGGLDERDYRFEQQLVGARNLIAILPEGEDDGNFGPNGKLRPNDLVTEVFALLPLTIPWQLNWSGNLTISGHSGGGSGIVKLMDDENEGRLPAGDHFRGVMMFDGIHDGQTSIVEHWIERRVAADLARLAALPDDAARLAYLATSTRFVGASSRLIVGVTEYRRRYVALRAAVDQHFAQTFRRAEVTRFGAAVRSAWRANYVFIENGRDHGSVLRDGDNLRRGLSSLPGQPSF